MTIKNHNSWAVQFLSKADNDWLTEKWYVSKKDALEHSNNGSSVLRIPFRVIATYFSVFDKGFNSQAYKDGYVKENDDV